MKDLRRSPNNAQVAGLERYASEGSTHNPKALLLVLVYESSRAPESRRWCPRRHLLGINTLRWSPRSNTPKKAKPTTRGEQGIQQGPRTSCERTMAMYTWNVGRSRHVFLGYETRDSEDKLLRGLPKRCAIIRHHIAQLPRLSAFEPGLVRRRWVIACCRSSIYPQSRCFF